MAMEARWQWPVRAVLVEVQRRSSCRQLQKIVPGAKAGVDPNSSPDIPDHDHSSLSIDYTSAMLAIRDHVLELLCRPGTPSDQLAISNSQCACRNLDL
jgi:hypothetical protein